jgi:HEPN domain-containing protein
MNDLQPSDVIKDWIIRARSDLSLGQAALITPGVLAEDACFHAQQCAEKALKGLLTYNGIVFPRTHAIEMLLDLLAEQGISLPDEINEAFSLSQYAVQTRYPGEWESVGSEEARIALGKALSVLAWVEGMIGSI